VQDTWELLWELPTRQKRGCRSSQLESPIVVIRLLQEDKFVSEYRAVRIRLLYPMGGKHRWEDHLFGFGKTRGGSWYLPAVERHRQDSMPSVQAPVQTCLMKSQDMLGTPLMQLSFDQVVNKDRSRRSLGAVIRSRTTWAWLHGEMMASHPSDVDCGQE
jgi:hypothetical protein